ncbi:beta-galactosidase [Agromyces sp. ISL-38]|uniref:glycoside hydrolase family 35 protein n=1 Tax=Agromyces sp. ISL-38 TaxID=2819107 RepID=UPI001BEB6346|nr:beta-galactosidase family protein [Agromyces sp. ISL-38]MBT2497933.1 beta-galactosidase [Agromyces sp. ISL-38]
MRDFEPATNGGVRVFSGALHYFRVHPDQWEHRIAMSVALGLDTIETYVPWNLHQPRPGITTFDGRADLARFLDLAHAAGLGVIVRPGPYICAEWDNGGIPSWVSAIPQITLRSRDTRWLQHVDEWFDVLVPLIAERQGSRGGPVHMVQVENEYGSYGSDAGYLAHLRDGLLRRGIDVPLFTSDGPTQVMLTGGSVPGVPVTVNFGSDPDRAFTAQRAFRPEDPLFCMELWIGWFDHWGSTHTVRDAADVADLARRTLDAGASLNLYMAHGGTNFGTGAGANRSGPLHDGEYQPTTTSYDYAAPIDECGAATATYWALRDVFAERRGIILPDPPPPNNPAVAGPVRMHAHSSLDSAYRPLGRWPVPPTFEQLGVDHGLVRYRARVPGPRAEAALRIDDVRDRAHLVVDGRLVAVLESGDHIVPLEVMGSGVDIEVIVESMGRVNYGPRLGEHKGLVGGVRHERQIVHGWDVDAIELAALPSIQGLGVGTGSTPVTEGLPVRSEGIVDVSIVGDAVLDVGGLSKGYVWINGELLGRYWDIGPTRGLYVPAPVLRRGRNDVTVVDVNGVILDELSFTETMGMLFEAAR